MRDGPSRGAAAGARERNGGPVQPRAGIAGKQGEGVMIAATRSLDETSLVHGRLGFGTPGWSCSTGMASGSPIRF
jgi:hypothetical protein